MSDRKRPEYKIFLNDENMWVATCSLFPRTFGKAKTPEEAFASIREFYDSYVRLMDHHDGICEKPCEHCDKELALAIRELWMRELGLSEEEIEEHCQNAELPPNLEKEVASLMALRRIERQEITRKELYEEAMDSFQNQKELWQEHIGDGT